MNAKADVKRLKLAVNGVESGPAEASVEAVPEPRTELRDNGVFFIGTKVAEGGKVIELPPHVALRPPGDHRARRR